MHYILRVISGILFVLIGIASQAQNGLNFQGVARNSNNVILASQPISLRLSIVQGSTNAVTEYTEVRKVTTNAQGLFNVVIGDTGTVSVIGNFSTIDWKLTPKFLKIEMDIAAGNNFSLIGTTQFQSVAYAQFASQVDAEKINGVLPVAKGGTGVASITALKASLALDKASVGLTNVDNTSDALKPISTAAQTALDTKVDKVTGKDLSSNDYTTVEKTKLAAITGTNTGDQDLSSYATNAAITLKENSANKSTATDLGAGATSDILFPTQKAVKTYVDGQINAGGIADGGILTRHLANGAVTGSKLASEIDGYKKFLDGAGNVTISNTVSTDVDVNTGSLAIGGTSNWQSFTAGLSGKLSAVEFQTVNPSSSGPAPIAYVEIYNGQGLSGSLLGTSSNISISGMGRNWYSFDLNGTNIRILAGNIYTARLVVNTTNQNYVYGDNAIYNGGISNISSTWDLNIKTKIKQFSDDPYLTTSVATGLYGGLVSNATHTGDVTGATALTIADAAVTTSKIVDAAVITSKIANSAVDLTTKVTGLLPTANVADAAITTAKIANSAVDLTTKVTGFLPTSNIADATITTAKIANSAVDLTTKVTGVLPTTNGGTGTITNTANLFFATPNGTAGAPGFRSLVVSDIPTNLNGYIQNAPSSTQSASININGAIVAGGIQNTPIGNITASTGTFTSLTTSGSALVGGTLTVTGSVSLETITSSTDLTINGIKVGIGGGNNTNTRLGVDALKNNSTGEGNIAIGYQSTYNNTNGYNNVAGGYQSLFSNLSGFDQIAFGHSSLYSNTTGGNNIAFGHSSLYSNTTGGYNIALGNSSLYSNTNGSYNIANGYRSLYFNTSGSHNVAYGIYSLFSNSTGSNNFASGIYSLYANTIGNDNIAIGQRSLYANTTGNQNIAFGGSSLENNTIGVDNIAMGYHSLKANTIGNNNFASGARSLTRNTTGNNNIAIGFESLPFNTSGSYNTANGYQSLYSNTTGRHNTANGYFSLYSNISGDYNNAIGVQSLYSNTTGSNNIASGFNSLFSNTTGSYNIASGLNSLYSNTIGNENVAIGQMSLFANTEGSQNIAIGSYSLYQNTTGGSNIAFGGYSLENNTIGFNNIALGYQSLKANTIGANNFASGERSLTRNTTGINNIAIGFETLPFNTTGSSNIAYGYAALYSNTTGGGNIAYGYQALSVNTNGVNNIAMGSLAGSYLVDGSDNITIGREAGGALSTGSNNIILGAEASPSATNVSNEITLGNSNITNIRSAIQAITSLSDRRDKTDIQTITEGVDFVKQLKPVTYTWNTRDKSKVGIKAAGFIAQDLLALQKTSPIGVNLDLVSENNPEKLEARYSNLLPVMVKAIQEQQVIIEDQKKRLEVLEKLVAELIKK